MGYKIWSNLGINVHKCELWVGVGEGERKGAWLALSPLSMHLAHSSIHLWTMGCGHFTLAQCGSLSGTSQVLCDGRHQQCLHVSAFLEGWWLPCTYVCHHGDHTSLYCNYCCISVPSLAHYPHTYVHRFVHSGDLVRVAGGCGDAHRHVCDAQASFAERSTVPVLAVVRSLCLSGCIACNISVFKLPRCTT